MPENEQPNPDEQPNDKQTDKKSTDAQTPPWGSDEEFNPEKAWQLVQNLRADKDKLTTKVTDYERSVQEAEDAKKDDLTKALDKVTAAEKRAAEAERQLIVAKALRDHPELSEIEDVEDFLTGETAEEIEAKAVRLAAGRKPAEPKQDPSRRPRSALVPGHSTSEADPEFDPDAIAKAARRR
jgi:hypothetical protein